MTSFLPTEGRWWKKGADRFSLDSKTLFLRSDSWVYSKTGNQTGPGPSVFGGSTGSGLRLSRRSDETVRKLTGATRRESGKFRPQWQILLDPRESHQSEKERENGGWTALSPGGGLHLAQVLRGRRRRPGRPRQTPRQPPVAVSRQFLYGSPRQVGRVLSAKTWLQGFLVWFLRFSRHPSRESCRTSSFDGGTGLDGPDGWTCDPQPSTRWVTNARRVGD